MKNISRNFALIFLLFGIFCSGHKNLEKKDGMLTVKKEDLMRTVNYLASDELEGRLSGSKGYDKAARYAADKFKNLGLKPAGDNGYFQNFKIEYNEILSPCCFELLESKNPFKKYELGRDYVFRGFTGEGDISAPVVFCGYGISTPERGYDDYAGIDVKGKIVMAFKQPPSWKINGQSWGRIHYPRPKSNMAAEHGAVGLILVSKPDVKNPQPLIGSVAHGPGEHNENFPQIHISITAANDVLKKTGYTISQLQEKIDSSKKPYSFEINTYTHIRVNTNYVKERETYNVVGLLEGSDPVLKDEYVVMGAHLDHCGKQCGKIYFPGANDNASGSAIVIEAAEAFVKGDVNPARSVVFILFSCEEQGLYGSRYYTENPLFPVQKTAAMINLDCVGHGSGLKVAGTDFPELINIALKNDEKTTKIGVEKGWRGGGADATPFYEKGVPTLYFVTTNSYTHLHMTSDLPETLNPDLFEKVARLAFLVVADAAKDSYKK